MSFLDVTCAAVAAQVRPDGRAGAMARVDDSERVPAVDTRNKPLPRGGKAS